MRMVALERGKAEVQDLDARAAEQVVVDCDRAVFALVQPGDHDIAIVQVLVHELAHVVEVRKAKCDLMSPSRNLRVRKMSACRLAGNHRVSVLNPFLYWRRVVVKGQ